LQEIRLGFFPADGMVSAICNRRKATGEKKMKLETLAVHGGYSPDPTTKAVAVPLYQTTSYAFDSTQHGADLFDLKVQGNIYTRIMNPTTDVLEKRVAALEGGIGALAVASGMAAISYAIQTIAEAGDNIIATSTLYGGTYNLFAHTFPQLGIEVRFIDYKDPASISKLVDGKTKAVFCESVGNPLGNVVDFAAFARSPQARPAADCGQYRALALSVPPLRAWRGYRGAQPHQIPGRPRHQHWRHYCRFRQIPLGRA
jgi:cystathionine beta-lyase/cystathionine gamma-synthase